MQTYAARVTRIDDLTHDVRLLELGLVAPPTLSFQAGQFISFSIAQPHLRHPLTRPYSIASPPNGTAAIELLFNKVPEGPGSGFLFSLGVGDMVDFRGAAGNFVLRDDPSRRLLFVATGTGIAPIRSMLHAALPNPRPITLIWGLRHERDRYFEGELAALASQHPEFSYTVALSQPSSEWTGPRGRVQGFVAPHLDRVDDLAVYVCGSSAMITSIVEMVRARGSCPIHREQYYRGEDMEQ